MSDLPPKTDLTWLEIFEEAVLLTLSVAFVGLCVYFVWRGF